MPEYPEHEKLTAVRDECRVISGFLEWIYDEIGASIAEPHVHTNKCLEDDGAFGCGVPAGRLLQTRLTREQIIGKYFDIDPKKLSQEKDQMLEEMRKS